MKAAATDAREVASLFAQYFSERDFAILKAISSPIRFTQPKEFARFINAPSKRAFEVNVMRRENGDLERSITAVAFYSHAAPPFLSSDPSWPDLPL